MCLPLGASNLVGDTKEQKDNYMIIDDHPYNTGFQGGG